MRFEDFITKHNISLNSEQKEAVASKADKTLLLAVPGSGKTTTLITKVGKLIEADGVPASKVLGITFTKAAAADMTKRYASIFGEVPDGLSIRTIHSFCYQVLRDRSAATKTPMPQILANTGPLFVDILKDILSEYPTESDIKEAQTMVTYVKNMMLSEYRIRKMKCCDVSAWDIYRQYRNRLRNDEMIDYDDLLVMVNHLFEKDSAYLARVAKRFRYILVDEAQDTSKIQHHIIEKLASQVGWLFMVGDEDQSIYGFRAAYPEAILSFKDRHPSADIYTLSKNYRSGSNIVTLANRIIENNDGRHDKAMVNVSRKKDKVTAPHVLARSSQYMVLIAMLREKRGETAILYRNNDSAVPLIYYLRKNNVAFRCRDFEPSFFTSKLVQDLCLICRFAQDQRDPDIFRRVYYRFGLKVSKKDVDVSIKNLREKDVSLLEPLQRIKRASAVMTRNINRIMKDLGKFPYLPAKEGLLLFKSAFHEVEKNEQERMKIIESLAEAGDTVADLVDRIDELNMIFKEGVSDPKAKVILSTIHGSKGLEFPNVILVDVVDGILPSRDKELLEEERRLFYVAVTRAKSSVEILEYGDSPSTFLYEAGLCRDQKTAPVQERSNSAEFIPITNSEDPSGYVPYRAAVKTPSSISSDGIDTSPGAKIVHRRVGEGTVESNDGEHIVIRYRDGKVKKYSLAACLSMGVLYN